MNPRTRKIVPTIPQIIPILARFASLGIPLDSNCAWAFFPMIHATGPKMLQQTMLRMPKTRITVGFGVFDELIFLPPETRFPQNPNSLRLIIY